MELINNSKNKLNSKINWLFNLEPNTLILEIFRGERERERERERDGEEVDSKFKREEMESLKNEGTGQWVTKDVFV